MNQTNKQSLTENAKSEATEKIKCFSTFWLKIIAILTMTIDHIGSCFGLIYKDNKVYFSNILEQDTYSFMRAIGRIAFPIFCYLIAEGFIYTRCLWKYALRLFIFALISQIPFNLLLYKNPFYIGGYLNVYFTLFIGLVVIFLADRIIDQWKNNPNTIYFASCVIILICAMCIAELLHTDYGAFGVLLIFIFYISRNKLLAICLCVAGNILLLSNTSELYALLALPLIFMHNKKRGPNIKYIFYAYYPVHMLIIFLIYTLI